MASRSATAEAAGRPAYGREPRRGSPLDPEAPFTDPNGNPRASRGIILAAPLIASLGSTVTLPATHQISQEDMPVLTLHHLDYSRSTRVLWLLEELGLAYRLVRYARPVGAAAPAALRAVHPQGRSPVLIDDEFILAESSAILRYLDRRYGNSRFTPAEEPERARHDEWLDYVEGSLSMPLFLPLMAASELPRSLRESFSDQLDRAWSFLEDALDGRTYLMGERLTLADIQLSYPLAVAVATGSLRDRPLRDYLDRLLANPALIRAIEAGGPMA